MPVAALAIGNVPKAANEVAEQMDKQIINRFKTGSGGSLSTYSGDSDRRFTRQQITIISTVPVNLNNLNLSCAAARQMSEEVSRWFINAGYKLQEMRKGRDIFFDRSTGETLLTRDTAYLATLKATGDAVLVGTYVISPIQVRFSLRLLHVSSNEVMAMGTVTVPITDDLQPLLRETGLEEQKVMPSIGTKLR